MLKMVVLSKFVIPYEKNYFSFIKTFIVLRKKNCSVKFVITRHRSDFIRNKLVRYNKDANLFLLLYEVAKISGAVHKIRPVRWKGVVLCGHFSEKRGS